MSTRVLVPGVCPCGCTDEGAAKGMTMTERDEYKARTDALIGTQWVRKRDGEVITIRGVTKTPSSYGVMPSWGWVHWTNGHGKAGDIHLDNLDKRYERFDPYRQSHEGMYPEWAK